jgi:hypothetical protein
MRLASCLTACVRMAAARSSHGPHAHDDGSSGAWSRHDCTASPRATRSRAVPRRPGKLTLTAPPLLYPRTRSSWTKRLITAKDHASVQINVGDVDPVSGRYTGTFKTFALCGYIRDKVSGLRRVPCGSATAPLRPEHGCTLVCAQQLT